MARLIVDSGPDAEMAFTLGTDVTTLGRSGSSTIQLRDGHVSRQHAEIVYRDNAYWARDLHSRNGTFVQGVRLTGERMLSHGDQIRIGHTVLIFSEEQGEPAAAEEKPPETSAVYLANEMIGDVKTSIHRETIFNEEMCGDHVKSLLWAVEKIHAATQPNRILPEIMDIVFDVFRPEIAAILALDQRTDTLVPRLVNAGNYDKEIVISRPIVMQSIQDAMCLLITHTEPGQGGEEDIDRWASSVHTALCAPLLVRASALGAIWVEGVRYEECYNEKDLRLLMAISNHAAPALSKIL